MALISRGGYGLTRILPGIKYKTVAKAIAGGTKFVGLSDFTAFQLAMLAQTGSVTWAGPALNADFGVDSKKTGEPVDDIMLDCFEDLLSGQGEGAGWQMPRIGELPNGKPQLKDFYVPGGATLWGGNLAVLVSLLGTPYFPQVDGGILFIEDVGEHPYRIERMLTQLLLAGVLQKQKAIVFGQFTEFKLTTHDKGFKLQTVIDWLRMQLKRPVLQGLPFGMCPPRCCCRWGRRCRCLWKDGMRCSIGDMSDARRTLMLQGRSEHGLRLLLCLGDLCFDSFKRSLHIG